MTTTQNEKKTYHNTHIRELVEADVAKMTAQPNYVGIFYGILNLSPDELIALSGTIPTIRSLSEDLQNGSGHQYASRIGQEKTETIKALSAGISSIKHEKRFQQTIDNIVTAAEERGDLFDTAEDGRFVIPTPIDRLKPATYDISLIDTSEMVYDLQDGTAGMSDTDKAKLVTDYLTHLTRRHTQDAVMSQKALDGLQKKIQNHLSNGDPLPFSWYLTMKKFPNPFDTRSSEVDISELSMVLEMKEFSDTIAKITGKAPTLTVMDESSATGCFSNASEDVYRRHVSDLIGELGVPNVNIRPFDHGFFSQYLTDRGTPKETAEATTSAIHHTLTSIYDSVFRNKLQPSELGDFLSQSPVADVLTNEQLARLEDFLHKNFPSIHAEGVQHIRTSRAKTLDPSIMFPTMSQSMWEGGLDKSNPALTKAQKSAYDQMRTTMNGQAQIQGTYFKALMKMRYVYHELYGEPVLSPDIIPLSITNAKDKLSWPLGRTKETGIVINGMGVEGVTPQHGMGVMVENSIVCIPWDVIVNNPDSFSPINIVVNGKTVSGYKYK